IAHWTLNTWVGAPALTRVFGEFVCGAALCRAIALSHKSPLPRGDILATGAFVAFLFGASAGLPGVVLVALLALTIFGTALSRGHVTRILGSRPLVWLGEISYSVYMVHFPVLIVIRRLWEQLSFAQWQPAARMFAFMATVGLILAVAAMLFYVVERPARTRLPDQMGRLAPA